jgi:deoxyribonuclease V
MRVAGVFAATPRKQSGIGAAGDAAFVAAAVYAVPGGRVESVVVRDELDAGYVAGLLALREGRVLERAVRALSKLPDVLLVNATGRDHPRRAGLALHLGAVCGLPSIGVTDRPLIAEGPEPGPERGDSAELRAHGEVVGYKLRTQPMVRAVIVHAGWRVDPATARDIVLAVAGESRTPAPLREARRLARTDRADFDG